MFRQLMCNLSIIMLLLLGTGCASPWEKNFHANPTLLRKTSYPPAPQVELRVVEFERLANYENNERQARVQNATSSADYTPQQRMAAKDRLLEALQLKERGNEIEILGWSRFVETEARDPHDADLLNFARKIGADVVVASIGYTGQVNRIVDYPLTSYSNYYTTVVGPNGRRQSVYSSGGSSTVWVPTAVTENQYYHQAVFLRRNTAPASATMPAAPGPS